MFTRALIELWTLAWPSDWIHLGWGHIVGLKDALLGLLLFGNALFWIGQSLSPWGRKDIICCLHFGVFPTFAAGGDSWLVKVGSRWNFGRFVSDISRRPRLWPENQSGEFSNGLAMNPLKDGHLVAHWSTRIMLTWNHVFGPMQFNLSLVSAEVSQATFKSGNLERPTSLNGKVSI